MITCIIDKRKLNTSKDVPVKSLKDCPIIIDSYP
jgi:hypothetical protein